MSNPNDHQKLFIQSLAKRIESLLPNRTGHSTQEVELNSQFIVTRKILLDKYKRYPHIITFIFTSFATVLENINEESQHTKLRFRDDKSRGSTLLVCKLLSEILQTKWNRRGVIDDKDSLSNYSRFYYYDEPKALDKDIITLLLDTFSNLLSSGVVKKVLSLVRNEQSMASMATAKDEQDIQREDQPMTDEELIASSIVDIDSYIETILRYISTANPDDYYDYIYDKLFRYSRNDEIIPLPILQKYSPLIKFMFFSQENSERITEDVINAIPFIKSNTWRQVFLFFLSYSVKDQTFSRTKDYEGIVDPKNTRYANNLKSLFDTAGTAFDDSITSVTCASFVLTWFLVLCLDDFVEINTGRPINKLKLTFNKRVRYLMSILRDSANCTNLESFDALISIFHLGTRLNAHNITNHPVLIFSNKFLDQTYRNLLKFGDNHRDDLITDDELLVKFEYLTVNFYIAAIILRPERYTKIIIQNFNSNQEELREAKILVKIIKGLSEIETAQEIFYNLINQMLNQLVSLMYGSLKMMHQYDLTHPQHQQHCSYPTPVTDQSLFSDVASIECGQSLQKITNHTFSTRKTNLDHYVHEVLVEHSTSNESSASSTTNTNTTASKSIKLAHSTSSMSTHSAYKFRLVVGAEELLSDIFRIFCAAPELYFNDMVLMDDKNLEIRDYDQLIKEIMEFCYQMEIPLRYAFRGKCYIQGNTRLFDSARELSLKLVSKNTKIESNYTTLSAFANFFIVNCIVQSICETCLSLSLTDPKFKACFLFLNDVLIQRNQFTYILASNKVINDQARKESFSSFGEVIHAVEKVLLLSVCTHDIQFYNYAKEGMKWYINEMTIHHQLYRNIGVDENLLETFVNLSQDVSVFTGFISLHKRHRTILREAKPTKSLFQVWVLIYYRWLMILENKPSIINEENLIFRHFTGFLVSTSGCFMSNAGFKDKEIAEKSPAYMSEFFDKCVGLLNSSDLVVRVIIKDTLSNESHSDVYHLIATKLMTMANNYAERQQVTDEGVVFVEQAMVIMSSMVQVRNDGTLLLSALLPNICEFFIRFVNKVDNLTDKLRLKLRFCKLGTTLEQDRTSTGLNGAYKLRNFYAKASCEWLEDAVFYDEKRDVEHDSDSVVVKESEIAYLNMDLAVQSSRCLRGQLENLVLEIPEGIRDSDINKYKDLAFGNYFSLFYKIIQKYSKMNLSANKSKHKLNQISENILACITNLLQYDSDIGMQFVLPMGYHETAKVRAIFLNVFANMLSSKTMRGTRQEYPDEIIEELTSQTEIFGAIAESASSLEHNLLASSLFGIFCYSGRLDELFNVLLVDEISHLTRSTDLFRRNSTLTRLLFNFTQDYGMDYLNATLRPIIEELVDNQVIFEVEKSETINPDLFFQYFNKLVDSIVSSEDQLPASFKFVCGEIACAVGEKFKDASIIAVGSFMFLRYLCPAIISPEQFFKIPINHVKVKRSLMQLVKVLQNMANGTISSIKWPALTARMDELLTINTKIYDFLSRVSSVSTSEYPFQRSMERPVAELRYLHKFIYCYFVQIRIQFILAKSSFMVKTLHDRAEKFKAFDKTCMKLGQPKPSVKLQINSTLKMLDPNTANGESSIKFNDFMTKMSLKYAEVGDTSGDVIHSSIFKDGTPVVVVNFKKMKHRPDDTDYLVYKLFETASQVWDNRFYMVIDFTEFNLNHMTQEWAGGEGYVKLVNNFSTDQFFKNCARVYYYNIPRTGFATITDVIMRSRARSLEYGTKLYTYSQVDSDEIINRLCLDRETMAISKDNKVKFKNVQVYDPRNNKFVGATIKIGRKFLQICFDDRVLFSGDDIVTKGFTPVEIYRLSDFVKCEVSRITEHDDEFTIYLSLGTTVTFRSADRLEILRFLYYTTSRLPAETKYIDPDKDYQNERHTMHWFGRLYNIVFQGLLTNDDEVKSAAALLFGSLSSYFDIDFGIKENHAKSVSFPANTADFVVSVSDHLASSLSHMTYRFFKSFFDNYDKIPPANRLTSILYISPWIENVYDYVYLSTDENGPERVADLIRQFCRLSAMNKDHIAIIIDYIWKKLFSETRLISVLVDEVVAFAIDNKNEGPQWTFIIAIIIPSIEVCGEVINRLISCINRARTNDSAIVSQSKIFEIKVLIKICSSLFFNSYTLARLYLADLVFFVSLFIDNSNLDIGSDLQKLIIGLIQSFLHKPDLTEAEQKLVDDTIEYFSTLRAKMLFGMTRDSNSSLDISQSFNRITNFEVLCDYLNEFISAISSTDDKTNWKSRWCSNAIDVAFSKDSLFQDRAILIVGILSKSGISDSTACRTIKLVANGELPNLDFVICISVATSRILMGLPDTSILPPILIWPQFCFGLLNYTVLYQASIQNITTSVLKMIRVGPDYIQHSYQQRQLLEPHLSEFEKRHGFHITPTNFGAHIFFVLTQGLRFSQFKSLSLSCIKEYFTTRYQYRDRTVMDGAFISNNAYPYLVFTYLCSEQAEFEKYVEEIELATDYVQIGSCRIPKVIIDFLSQGTEASKVTLIHAGFFFNDIKIIDGEFKSKFLILYHHLFELNRENGFLIYDILKPALNNDLVTTTSIDVVDSISNIITEVSMCDDYVPEKYTKEVEEILVRNKIEALRSSRAMKNADDIVNNSKPGFRLDFFTDIKIIQTMLYRSACVYVEGLKLED
ncbi:ras GTPase activating protein RasGAP/neurofibromin [Spathaspora passalidarum NRRL Y-27907]|uniref:Ras GTPase activating protein RasGAP/neurofibromin n=1 Tax=Spathaspora passalidarum (strain NRRL Y-27907 / 11-Y1) TaxID=619300 RepID=G3ANC7_SPAPN|nr:ras GTPase activating protein RasGAP/neurofibromin [Spathaspora passalidarum NRRL Y-27907]EGW32510.1 ras GTPase activating protein RasGAP/neurofibromin [Spathaspora passalidarum NRRL Y-27907]